MQPGERLTMRPLDHADVPDLQRLLEADPEYALRVDGHRPSMDAATDLLTTRPPGVAPFDKVLLGAHLDGCLVAVVDLIRGWPETSVAHVGLLQVHAAYQRQELGRRVHDLMLDHLRIWPEVSTLRAAIVQTNAAHATPFWSAVGYRHHGDTRPFRAGSIRTTVSIWSREAPSTIGRGK